MQGYVWSPDAEYAVRDAPFYGAPIGILLIDSSEPFVQGDVGNASTFGFPVRYERVPGCTIERLVVRHDRSLVDAVIASARKLVNDGARAIASNCGFMLRMQEPVAEALDVPVLLSGLLQLPLVERSVSTRKKIGVITSTARFLDLETVALSGVEVSRVEVAGLDECVEFRSAFLDEKGIIRPGLIEREVAQVASDLASRCDLGAVVMECAALPAYASTIQRAVGDIAVFDAVTLIESWFRSLHRSSFGNGHF